MMPRLSNSPLIAGAVKLPAAAQLAGLSPRQHARAEAELVKALGSRS